MSLGGRVSPWRSAVEEGRSPLGRFRKPEPCFPRTYATWDAKKDENRFGSVKFRLTWGCKLLFMTFPITSSPWSRLCAPSCAIQPSWLAIECGQIGKGEVREREK